MDNLSQMIEWEEGTLDQEGEDALFQNLLDTGLCWKLQGMYSRRANDLIYAGRIA